MGKSLDQVWQQMRAQAQAQRQAEVQRQLAQERAINEQRERSRLEYLQRMKMNERLAPTAAAASAAAGAGGSGNREPELQTIQTEQSTIFFTDEDGVFSYFIYNFGTSQITDIKSLTDGVWSGTFNANVTPIHNSGFCVDYPNQDTNERIFNYIGLNGEVVWRESVSSGYYNLVNFGRYDVLYYEKDEIYKLSVFYADGTYKVYDFEHYVSGGGYAFDYVYDGGFVVHEAYDTTRKYYLLNDKEQPILFKEYDSDLEDLSVYLYAFSDKITTVTNGTLWRIYDKTGAMICEYDILEDLASWYLHDFGFLAADGSFVMNGPDSDNDEYNIIFYSGSANQFSRRSLPDDYIKEYGIFDQMDYDNLRQFDPRGAGFYWFYTDDNNINGFKFSDENYILPIWSTDSVLRNFFTFSNTMGVLDQDSRSAFIRNENHLAFLVNKVGRLYLFSDSSQSLENFNFISDGGDDMYDSGNYIYADSIGITYSHTQMFNDRSGGMQVTDFIMDGTILPGFGASGSYFTNLYPGMFLMAAQGTEIDEFKIGGYLGADSLGDLTSYNFQVITGSSPSTTWQAFVKQVSGTQEPSVNHMIIVNAATASGITQSYPNDTDNDEHILSGLLSAGVSQIYFMLMALRNGEPMSNSEINQVVTTLINKIEANVDLSSLLNALSTEYTDITETITPIEGPYYEILRFNKTGDETTYLSTTMSKAYESYDVDMIYDRTILQLSKQNNINNTYGWGDLSDIETRRYTTFREALNANVGNYILNRELVMWDTVNDQYWAIKFNQWQNNANGGAFRYTRQLIVGGTYSGSVISFTHSNYGNQVDVISPGVLEITRGVAGPIYNAVLEQESNGQGPSGTKWNSEYANDWTDYTHTVVGSDAQVISTLQTENYNNEWDGRLHIVKDQVGSKTYVSNLQEGSTWQLLDDVYTDLDWIDGYLTDDGIYSSRIVYYTANRFRVITENEIYDEFTVSDDIEDYIKIEDVRIGAEVLLIIRSSNSLGTEFLFYSFDGTLLAQSSVPDGIQGINLNYQLSLIGKRVFVWWWYDSGETGNVVIYSDGQIIQESLDGTNLRYEHNDYFNYLD